MRKIKALAMLLAVLVLSSLVQLPVSAQSLMDELFGFSYYYFHYIDENGKMKDSSTYDWGSDIGKENGVTITKTGIDSLRVEISAAGNELYEKTSPVLMWVHKADGIFDITKYTDIDQWYRNKLSETFLLQRLDPTATEHEFEIKVPIKLNIGGTGLINGGYYELEFYGEGAIPEQLQFAYEAQTYTLKELEEYIQTDMSENIDDYYNVDSGFRPELHGFAFANADFQGGGVCSGITSITTAKYNGYDLVNSFELGEDSIVLSDKYSWCNSILGNSSIRDITFEGTNFGLNTPSLYSLTDGTATAYPSQPFRIHEIDSYVLGQYLHYYQLMNNAAIRFRGNSSLAGINLVNLENRWSIIDYVVSYMRQGKAVTVNLISGNSGHAIVGYRMERIDEDTYRLYCYDNCYPDDYKRYYIEGNPENYDLNEDGSFANVMWKKGEVYVDITKNTKRVFADKKTYKEVDVFEFDSSNTSFATSSADGGLITFSLCTGDSIKIFNYGNEANEVIAYKSYPVIKADNTVEMRTFAYYQSGEVREISNSQYTTIKMDYAFIGQYKIKDSKIILTKDNYKFVEEGNSYIDVYVSYDDNKGGFGQIKVRIPVNIE